MSGRCTPLRSPIQELCETECPASFAFNRTAPISPEYATNLDIFVMNADGTGLRQLTHDSGDNYAPTWSPDANSIAFVSTRCGSHEIYVMNADGTGVVQLTDDPEDDFDPAWSPTTGTSE